MEKWYGSAGICVSNDGKVLMVKQGKPEDKKLWTVPSGGKEENESYEECCVREIWEETGYNVNIMKYLFKKEGTTFGIPVEVHYYEVAIQSGKPKIQDPDQLIYEIAWKSADEVESLDLSFPDDRELLMSYVSDVKIHSKIEK